jgi:hypothetical protein
MIQSYQLLLCCFLFRQQLDAFLFSKTYTRHRSLSLSATENNVPDAQRRQTCLRIIASSIFGTTPFIAHASTATKESLKARVENNLLTPPSYGLEGADVYYPTWFEGKWAVQSSLTSVEAPCGIALFGGNSTWETAQREQLQDPPLQYEARFVPMKQNQIIADREFNVRSIAQAVMGPQSVLDIPFVTPNKLTCVLAPKGASSPFQVDLMTLQRQQERPTEHQFDCSEVSREIITAKGSSTTTTTVLKEVETISLYSYQPTTQSITCQQRSAKFILPSQQDPTALRLWQMTGGKPVDVRYYTVTYQRI